MGLRHLAGVGDLLPAASANVTERPRICSEQPGRAAFGSGADTNALWIPAAVPASIPAEKKPRRDVVHFSYSRHSTI